MTSASTSEPPIARTGTSILDLPPDLLDLRARVFSIDSPIALTKSKFDAVWPYLDNIYVVNKDRPKTSYYWCRRWRKEARSDAVPAEKRQRVRLSQKPIGCPCKIKIVKEGHTVTIYRTSDEGHNHDYSAVEHKLTSGVRELVRQEVSKGYRPRDVNLNLKNSHNGNLGTIQTAGGQFLDIKGIHNAGKAFLLANPDIRTADHGSAWQIQLNNLIELLQRKDWLVSRLDGPSQSHGVAFADPRGVKHLTRRGYLTLMDSTHNTNHLKWYLTTLMIRDEHMSWIPAVFFLHDGQDSDILATGLKKAKSWCGNRWLLRYMLLDDSAGEQAAIKKAFRGLADGEQEVGILLCMVHSDRTLRRHFGKKDDTNATILRHLHAALFTRRTEAGCHDSIDSAVKACGRDKKKADYILKEWKNTAANWAMYARFHSALLLQVRTTNSIESWHRVLKSNVSQAMNRWSLAGIGSHVVDKFNEYMNRANQRASEFRTKYVTDFHDMPMLCRFPYPVQQLIQKELKVVEDDDEDIIIQDVGDDPSCRCYFFLKWQLPCRHILKQEREFGSVLTDEYWNRWHFMWEESGFEIYEGMTKEYINAAVDEEIGAPVRRKLQIREVLDSLLARYYDIEASTSAWPSDIQNEVVQNWIKGLDVLTGPVRQQGVSELKEHISSRSQRVLDGIDSGEDNGGDDGEDMTFIDFDLSE